MTMWWVFAQTESSLPESGSTAIVWGVVAIVIVGLYLVIRRTRRRSMDHYLSRRRREEELKRQDPDLRQDPDD